MMTNFIDPFEKIVVGQLQTVDERTTTGFQRLSKDASTRSRGNQESNH